MYLAGIGMAADHRIVPIALEKEKVMHAREWMHLTGEHATELRSLVGEEIFNNILADMDEFAETVREPIQCGQTERDAKVLAESNLEMLEALEFVEAYVSRLEEGTQPDDPLGKLRTKFHAAIHGRLRPLIRKGRS